MRLVVMRLLVVVGVLLAGLTPASAVCVEGIPVCQLFWGYDTVFEGSVVSIDQRAGTPPAARGAPAQQFDTLRQPHKVVTFDVIRSWRGARGPRIQIIAPGGPNLWVEDVPEFVEGRRYVVFGWRAKDANHLVASTCGPGGPAGSTGANVALAFLETLSQPSPGGRVFGGIFDERTRRPGERLRPSVETSVVLEGEGTRRVVRSVAGSFEFGTVRPGRYTLTITVPPEFETVDPLIVDVPDVHACAQRQFFLVPAKQ